jgi:hypothetical protein
MASARLASDLDNPDYTGATNPDSRLAVMFYSKPIENEFQSMAQGRPIFEDRDFVKIFVPGDPTTVVDTFVREDHKARFPCIGRTTRTSTAATPRKSARPCPTGRGCSPLRSKSFAPSSSTRSKRLPALPTPSSSGSAWSQA